MASPRQAIESDTESSTRSTSTLLPDNFPSKAFLVIEYCDNTDSDVACWSDDGTYFVVKDTATFANSHLPRYFKHSNFQSFVRQLNIYGWRTVKQHDTADGSVAFHHKSFLRGRRDLLGDIKRPKKSSKKHIQEEKKDDDAATISSFNIRFDEIQEQMDSLSEKLDLLISLVSANSESIVDTTFVRGKRRRQDIDGVRGSPVSEMSYPTAVSKETSSQSSAMSPRAAASIPRYTLDAVHEEDETYETQNHASPRKQFCDLAELRESARQFNEIRQHQAALEGTFGQDEDDFKMFIDRVLDGDEPCSGEQNEHIQDERSQNSSVISLEDSNALVADPLMSKENPDAVQGQTHIPEATASAVFAHADEEFDEETGDYVPSAPLTTAIEVTDASTVPKKQLSRRMKIFIGVVVLMVLTAFVIWPLVVFKGEKMEEKDEQEKNNGGNRRHDDFSSSRSRHSSHEQEWEGSEDTNENVFIAGGNQTEQTKFFTPEPLSKRNSDIPLSVSWDGEYYECVLHPP